MESDPSSPVTIRSAVLGLIGLYALSTVAFTYRARKEIMARDNWECQVCGRSWREGWHLQAAHFPDMHMSGPDNDSSNGRVLCTEDHIVEELIRGNIRGARLLHSGQTIRNYGWIDDHGGYDEKKSFGWYCMIAGYREP